MGFKFLGTSPGISAENYTTAATDGYIDGPLRPRRTVVCIRRARYIFCYFKLGHTRWNQRRVVTFATDHRRGTVAWLKRFTRPGWTLFPKSDRLNSPPLHISPHCFLISPITLSFELPHSLLPIIALSKFSKALKCYLLVETAAVSVYLATEYFCICFSPFLRYVSLIYTHLSCIFVTS